MKHLNTFVLCTLNLQSQLVCYAYGKILVARTDINKMFDSLTPFLPDWMILLVFWVRGIKREFTSSKFKDIWGPETDYNSKLFADRYRSEIS